MMSDLLIRNIPLALRRQIKERARKHRQSMSEEAKALMQRALALAPSSQQPCPDGKLGDYLFSLLEDKYRSDDFVFEINDYPTPPDFK
jgi:hypothetical protein